MTDHATQRSIDKTAVFRTPADSAGGSAAAADAVAASSRSPGVLDSSAPRPGVALVEGERPSLCDETAALLRRRLQAAALVISMALTIALLKSVFESRFHLIGFRVGILAAMASFSAALRCRERFSLPRLRLIELMVFGLVGVQIVVMQVGYCRQFATDPVSLIAALNQGYLGWTLLILIHGLFLPNSWQRAAILLLPAAAVPLVGQLLLQATSAEVAAAIAACRFGSPFFFPFIAALAAIYGAHLIHAIRQGEFQSRRFGQYRLLERIGGGGMGDVFKGEHTLLKRPCAIKLIKESDRTSANALAMFEREVRNTARLTHWNTVAIYDYGRTSDGTFYYVMELLSGMTLADLVKRFGPLPPERAVHFLVQACAGLHEAHECGLIHRDIKPANLFAARSGGLCDVIKVLDFGLVRDLAAESPRSAAVHGDADSAASPATGQATAAIAADESFGGSPLYMAPEQATDYSRADRRVDIYALGGVAYFLLTGQPPFSGNSMVEILLAHAREPVGPPSRLVPQIPGDLEAVVLKCLEKKPELRYQTVEELRRALCQCGSFGRWTESAAALWWQAHVPAAVVSPPRRDALIAK